MPRFQNTTKSTLFIPQDGGETLSVGPRGTLIAALSDEVAKAVDLGLLLAEKPAKQKPPTAEPVAPVERKIESKPDLAASIEVMIQAGKSQRTICSELGITRTELRPHLPKRKGE